MSSSSSSYPILEDDPVPPPPSTTTTADANLLSLFGLTKQANAAFTGGIKIADYTKGCPGVKEFRKGPDLDIALIANHQPAKLVFQPLSRHVMQRAFTLEAGTLQNGNTNSQPGIPVQSALAGGDQEQ
jgi:hypothetical protein